MKLDDFKNNLDSPILDGIVYPGGQIHLLDVKVEWTNPPKYTVDFIKATNTQSLISEEKLHWGSCSILERAICQVSSQQEVEILLGEGNFGSDGFIAILNRSVGGLIWLAYFTQSNPFYKARIEDREIVAISTLGCEWRFDISTPQFCSVDCLPHS